MQNNDQNQRSSNVSSRRDSYKKKSATPSDRSLGSPKNLKKNHDQFDNKDAHHSHDLQSSSTMDAFRLLGVSKRIKHFGKTMKRVKKEELFRVYENGIKVWELMHSYSKGNPVCDKFLQTNQASNV